MTIKDFAEDILKMYKTLLGEREYKKLEVQNNITSTRIKLLNGIIGGEITPNNMSLPESELLMDIFLDMGALQAASAESRDIFDPLNINEPYALGNARERRGALKNQNEHVANWHFQSMVQGWLFSHGFGEVKDLRNDKNLHSGVGRICDYAITTAIGLELIECKRIHSSISLEGDIENNLIRKLNTHFESANDQLQQTEKHFTDVKCRHLLIDISSYDQTQEESLLATTKVVVSGFNAELVSSIGKKIINDWNQSLRNIDRITLCWRNFVTINGKVIAVIQNSISFKINQSSVSGFEYSGWTAEGYPLNNDEYRELRLSNNARTVDWLVTSFNNMKDPSSFYKVSKPVDRTNKES